MPGCGHTRRKRAAQREDVDAGSVNDGGASPLPPLLRTLLQEKDTKERLLPSVPPAMRRGAEGEEGGREAGERSDG